MKKNVMMRVASALLVAVLLTTCAISGTFAKYVSTSTGTDSARVALWKVELEDAAIADTFTFDLFNTVKDSNVTDNETDVKAGEGETIIAPGTSGSFEINLENASEVNAEYDIAYTVTNEDDIPVEFKIGEGEWTSDLATLDATDVEFNMGATASVTVQWRWAYYVNETADAADTELGLDGSATITVDADVTVTQVD